MNKLITFALLVASLCGYQVAIAGGDATAGKAISEQTCQACHGVDGDGSNTQYPKLAGQHADYLVRALMDYKSGARKNPIMSGFATTLSKQDQKDVAAWFSSQSSELVTPSTPRQVQ